MPNIGQTIKVPEDFYIEQIAGRPVRGQKGIVRRHLFGNTFVVEVEGLAPYGHDGCLALVMHG